MFDRAALYSKEALIRSGFYKKLAYKENFKSDENYQVETNPV